LSGINSLATELETALKSLQSRWVNTTALWNDSVSRGFETQFLHTIERDTQTALNEMNRLAQSIVDAHRQVK
jgi:hypothetical protein